MDQHSVQVNIKDSCSNGCFCVYVCDFSKVHIVGMVIFYF